ncbi:hypothetical protein V8C86DRAFT_617545 [Haematococcus lacustris]|uniref:Membrane selenoprotein n=1 Tax=Haematococcus lacustris TaxID=44745 RepID=A0A699ZFA5_HAELA|nr:membrane selenoprotein [Haematococcus lacustris]
MAVLTNLTQYTYHKAASRSGTLWQRQGPTLLLALATPLLLADLVRHCLQDAGLWTGPSSSMYRDDCDEVSGIHGLACLTLVGWLFSILFTYSGFVLMISAVFWSASLGSKVRRAWSQIQAAT